MTNLLGVVICLIYIFAIIGLAEGLRRWRGYSSGFTRKVIHIGVGMLAWAVPFLFDTPWYFVAACLAFAVLNFLDWRFHFFKSMAALDGANLGTVYFPLSAAVVVIMLWENPPLMVAALMPLTWGDGMAPVIGQTLGRHPYTVFGYTRTWEGSAAFFLFGLFFTWLALWVIPGPQTITPLTALAPAGITMLVTTFIEDLSVRGLDNLTVTAGALAVLWLWPF